MMEVSFVIKTH